LSHSDYTPAEEKPMTVAAVIIVPEAAAGLAAVDGEPALRRVAQSAWSGGVIPIVVVTPEPGEAIAQPLADLQVTFVPPGPDEPRGIAWFVCGLRTALESVSDTTAALLWPVPHVWVDPETVTSLVEAHGAHAGEMVRAVYGGQPGLPILIPATLVDRLAALSGQRGVEAVEALAAEGVPLRLIELGDPGIVHDISTPRADLPAYQGPSEPASGAPPEWNEALARSASPTDLRGPTGPRSVRPY
jgi:molybdenum cofactor cytidylyltransferase